MSHKFIFALLGVILFVLGLMHGGFMFIVTWMGCNFMALSFAHWRGCHGIFGKRRNGTIPVWSWILFLPLLGLTQTVWQILRLSLREPAFNIVSDDLVVGRRLLPKKITGEFANYVDLRAEFKEPQEIRRRAGYISFPILDASVPTAESLNDFIAGLRHGRTFLHCAQGHGRTGVVALALLLESSAVKSVEEGLEVLQMARLGICLNRTQHEFIRNYEAAMAARRLSSLNEIDFGWVSSFS